MHRLNANAIKKEELTQSDTDLPAGRQGSTEEHKCEMEILRYAQDDIMFEGHKGRSGDSQQASK